LRVQAGDVREVTGRDCRTFGFDAVAVAFEVLRLRPVSGPPPGACTVEAQRAAYSTVGATPGEEGVDLSRRGVGRAESQLDDSARYRIETLTSQRMFKCWLANILHLAVAPCEPSLQRRNLVGAGQRAVGDARELVLCRLAGGRCYARSRLEQWSVGI